MKAERSGPGRVGPRRLAGPVLAPPRTAWLQPAVGQRRIEYDALAQPVEERAALALEEETLVSSADQAGILPDRLAWAWEMTQAHARRHMTTKIDAPTRTIDYLLARHAFDRWL